MLDDEQKGQVASQNVIESNDTHSIINMVRIDGKSTLDLDNNNDGDVSCEEIRALRDLLVLWLDADDARCKLE